VSLLRIRIQAPADPARRSNGEEAQAGDSYVERLLKLIPAEAIGIYLVGVQIVGSDVANHPSLAQWTAACAVFVVTFRAILSTESPKFGIENAKALGEWWEQFRKEVQWPAVTIATISFLVWATALGYPIAPWLSATFNACGAVDVICAGEKAGTLVLLLWTPLAAFLYTGERVGNLASDAENDNNAGPKPGEPSPKDALPPSTQRDVLHPDERSQPPRINRKPYQSIALLHTLRSGHSQPTRMGTGWLATPKHVVTAAHVLSGGAKIRGWLRYDGDRDTWGAFFESGELRMHPNYVNNANPDYDVAVIELPDALTLPFLEIKDPGAQASGQLRCTGYPEDKGGLTMFDAGGAIEHRVDNRVFHDIDTDEGQSGSPIWSGMGQRVAAVHTGHGGDPHPDLNRGVAMNAEIVGWLTDQFN